MARAVDMRGSIPARSARATACTRRPEPAATCARLNPCRLRACFKLSTTWTVTFSFIAVNGGSTGEPRVPAVPIRRSARAARSGDSGRRGPRPDARPATAVGTSIAGSWPARPRGGRPLPQAGATDRGVRSRHDGGPEAGHWRCSSRPQAFNTDRPLSRQRHSLRHAMRAAWSSTRPPEGPRRHHRAHMPCRGRCGALRVHAEHAMGILTAPPCRRCTATTPRRRRSAHRRRRGQASRQSLRTLCSAPRRAHRSRPKAATIPEGCQVFQA
jgi:hypothetical protein